MIIDRRHMREELAALLGMLMNQPPLPVADEDAQPAPEAAPVAADYAEAVEEKASEGEAEPAETS